MPNIIPQAKHHPTSQTSSHLTSQVSKRLEGFTLNLLWSQVADQLDPKQFSLPKKSTMQAAVYMLHSLLAGLESGQCSVRIFFADFKKGFDFVDHNVLNDVLVKLGVHPAIHRWIRDFLTNREQCVQIQSPCSSWKMMNGGLPQGTKLGPLLFAILVNNLLKNWHGRIKFVDDTTTFEIIPRGSLSILPMVVDEISNFASIRGMQLNQKEV